ncbi:hypothetical protein QP265_25635, partial [Escherichia coli]|nr:hypothetical protein [Escherichia coli]
MHNIQRNYFYLYLISYQYIAQYIRFAKTTDPEIKSAAKENINIVSTFTPVVTKYPDRSPKRECLRL